MRKTIIIAAAAIIAAALSIWGFVSMRSETVSSNADALAPIPRKPCAILRVNSVEGLADKLLYDNGYWRRLASIDELSGMHAVFSELDSLRYASENISNMLQNRCFVLSAYVSDADSDSGSLTTLLSAQISAAEHDDLMKVLEKKNIPGYCVYERDLFMFSSDEKLLREAQEQAGRRTRVMETDSVFMRIYATAGDKAAANLFLDMEQCGALAARPAKNGSRLAELIMPYKSWCGFDVDISRDKLVVSGFTINDAADDLSHLFEGQEAAVNTLVKNLPYNTYFFCHYALTDLELYVQKAGEHAEAIGSAAEIEELERALESPTGESPRLFFEEHFNREIALGMNPQGQYVLARIYDEERAGERLRRYFGEMNASKQTIGGCEIYHLSKAGFAGSVFGPLFSLGSEYITLKGNCLIIAESPKLAQYVASRRQDTQTLQCSPAFRQADATLLSSSNMSIYADIPYLTRNASAFIDEKYLGFISRNRAVLSDFESFGMQAEAGRGDLNYQQLFVQYSSAAAAEPLPERETVAAASTGSDDKGEAVIESSAESSRGRLLYDVTLDAPARMQPQPVINHYTGETELAVQDANNTLYLISAEGKILWKANLTGAIVGGITQVDMLKNKKLQLAFVTGDKMYIVDRNGNALSGFPRSLKAGAGAGLSVFDYDGRRDYRFFYPAVDGRIVLLSADGSVPGTWTSPKMAGSPAQPVRHFTIAGKDYLVCADGERFYFYDRRGRERIKPLGVPLRPSDNPIYADLSRSPARFVYAASDGSLQEIGLDGKTSVVSAEARDGGFFFYPCVKDGNVRYLFFSPDGVSICDNTLASVYGDPSVKSASKPAYAVSGSLAALSDPTAGLCAVYDISSAKKLAEIDANADYLAIADFKQYRATCVVVADGANVRCYRY